MIAVVIVGAVGLAGGGLFILTNTNPAKGGAENSSTEQADMGTLGILDTSHEESDQKEDIQKSSTEKQPSDNQASNGHQPPPSSSDDEAQAEEEVTQPQENLTSPNEESLIEKEDPIITDSDAATGRDEQQNPPSSGQPEEDITETEEDPAETVELPLNRVRSEIEELQLSLKQAIKNRQWANVDAPLVEYYYVDSNLETLYSGFNIIEVESSSGELESDDATATLPVTVNISYQQKGREDLQYLSIPANWVWKKGDEGFILSEVYKP